MWRIDWDAVNALPERDRFALLAELPNQVKAACAAARAQLVIGVKAREGTSDRAGKTLGITKQRIGKMVADYEATGAQIIRLTRSDDEGTEVMTLVCDGEEVRQIVVTDGALTSDTIAYCGSGAEGWLRDRLTEYHADGWS